MLRNAQTGPLADQRGHTVDDLRNRIRQGEDQARQVAQKNGVKESAYGTAYDSMVSLRHDLTNMAEEGNKRIKEIQDSKEPVEAKVPQIVAAIHEYRALANMAAAKYSGNVFDAMQRILDAEGTGQSARQFAQSHGVDVGQMFRATRRPKGPDAPGTGLAKQARLACRDSPTARPHSNRLPRRLTRRSRSLLNTDHPWQPSSFVPQAPPSAVEASAPGASAATAGVYAAHHRPPVSTAVARISRAAPAARPNAVCTRASATAAPSSDRELRWRVRLFGSAHGSEHTT